MTDMPDVVLNSLAERYLVANTPAYLLKHFLGDEGVAELARRKPTGALFTMIADVEAAEKRTLADVVAAYAAAAAIILHDDAEARSIVDSPYPSANLEWIADFFAIARGARPTTSTGAFTATRPSASESIAAANTTNVNTANVNTTNVNATAAPSEASMPRHAIATSQAEVIFSRD